MKVRTAAGALLMVLGATALAAGIMIGSRLDVPIGGQAAPPVARRPPSPEAAINPPATPEATATPAPTPRSAAALEAEVGQLLSSSGASGGVTLIELAGAAAETWALNGDQAFVAASTYKLPVLMEDAQNIAEGRASPNDSLCYQSEDWEDGYFSDYQPGDCYTRAELDRRAGTYSDNTAAHILVRYVGGTDALNAYARQHGATESAFYDPNVTTSNDLARLWQNEAEGGAGGPAAQGYLYPLLTDTAYEDGISAGEPAGTTVVHKIGILDGELNDAALVENGPRGSYVLAITTENASWTLIASIARDVAQFEAS